VDVNNAELYIENNFIDLEDWQSADQDKKNRLLNAADTTLRRHFSNYVIPDNAVYHFAAILAVVFNDTNRYQQHGVAGFSVTGVASFTFKENNVKTPGGAALSSFISDDIYALIGEANSVKLSKRRVGRSVR
jgi:hypothetical protein